MEEETIIQGDLTVVGAGVAGCIAAIAAARSGIKVALVNDRPVLGGNSSSEIRVWISGATGGRNNYYARETGIIGELLTENNFRNPEGNPHVWDMILLDLVTRENNLNLFLNTHVSSVIMDGNEIIASGGIQLASQRKLCFKSPLYIDASGDGMLGYLSGAEYRIGRECQAEFNESMAPPITDAITLGSTLLFYVKDTGNPVRFIPPAFAYSLTEIEAILAKRPNNQINVKVWGCHYWWFEYGGLLDTINENEKIATELRKFIYGIWNYIKNSGKFAADNLTLEWVGNIPGKRESRRFIGDYILNQNDIVKQKRFPDAVCYGGWPIDTHPPEGVYSTEPGCCQAHLQGIYDIPLRSLYSRNVNNLMFAGRNISATHIAFASTRVMATCGLMGEAVGMAASLCKKQQLKPRQIYPNHIKELQEMLIHNDGYIIGRKNSDPADLAIQAQVTTSSCKPTEMIEDNGNRIALTEDLYFLLPAAAGRIDILSVLIDAQTTSDLKFEVYQPDHLENYLPVECIFKGSVRIGKGFARWQDIDLNLVLDRGRFIFIRFIANPEFNLCATDALVGTMACRKIKDGSTVSKGDFADYYMHPAGNICFRVSPEQGAYKGENVINGFNRPYGLPNLWISAEITAQPQWLQLDFTKPFKVSEILLFFGAELNQPLLNLQTAKTFVYNETVGDYTIYALRDGQAELIFTITDNYQRFRNHKLNLPITADGIKIIFSATHGSKRVQVYGIRVYS